MRDAASFRGELPAASSPLERRGVEGLKDAHAYGDGHHLQGTREDRISPREHDGQDRSPRSRREEKRPAFEPPELLTRGARPLREYPDGTAPPQRFLRPVEAPRSGDELLAFDGHVAGALHRGADHRDPEEGALREPQKGKRNGGARDEYVHVASVVGNDYVAARGVDAALAVDLDPHAAKKGQERLRPEFSSKRCGIAGLCSEKRESAEEYDRHDDGEDAPPPPSRTPPES